jgi:hypothetical protein
MTLQRKVHCIYLPRTCNSAVFTVTSTLSASTAARTAAAGIVLAAAVACSVPERDAAAPTSTASPAAARVPRGLLYGRVTLDDGTVHEGRLRFGGDEEALWGNTFNSVKDGNPWEPLLARDQRPRERISIELFGIEVGAWNRRLDLGRPFMARFGDIARIDARGKDLRITLKSGTGVVLDRYASDDLADGLRVWDEEHGVVDLGEWAIRSIEFLASAAPGGAPAPLYGTVRTRRGDFTGLVQWDREACLGSDQLVGLTTEGEVRVRFEDVRSIERRGDESSLVTLRDGRTLVMSGSRQVGVGNRGAYVDDPRYGRVLVSWDVFERVDFAPGGAGPAYGDFPAGRPLMGRVATRSGRTLAGRLVYDLDESETTETLDAPSGGVDYTIPFAGIAAILTPGSGGDGARGAVVILRSGEELWLDSAGGLGDQNAGLLVFGDGEGDPEYVPWANVERIDFYGDPVT